MRSQRFPKLFTSSLLWGIGGGIVPPSILILIIVIKLVGNPAIYGFLLLALLLGAGVGFMVGTWIGLLFVLINNLFGYQRSFLYEFSLFACPALSFITAFFLYGAWIWTSLNGIAHA
jgi:hypothetical protein